MSERFAERAAEHQRLLRKRGFPISAEDIPPTSHAALWHQDAIRCVPRTARDVARQLARLCGTDSTVTLPWRSLADAVGKANRSGMTRAYTERGVEILVEAGWLEVETVGLGCRARTTFRLMPGDRVEWYVLDEDDTLEDAA